MSSKHSPIHQILKDGYNELTRYDDLMKYVLDSHIVVEKLLVEWLRLAIPKPEKILANDRSPCDLKIRLCNALDLIDDDLADILHKLNGIRNDYAHKISFSLDCKTAKEFLDSVRKAYNPSSLRAADPTELFDVVKTLHYVVNTLIAEIKKHPKYSPIP